MPASSRLARRNPFPTINNFATFSISAGHSWESTHKLLFSPMALRRQEDAPCASSFAKTDGLRTVAVEAELERQWNVEVGRPPSIVPTHNNTIVPYALVATLASTRPASSTYLYTRETMGSGAPNSPVRPWFTTMDQMAHFHPSRHSFVYTTSRCATGATTRLCPCVGLCICSVPL